MVQSREHNVLKQSTAYFFPRSMLSTMYLANHLIALAYNRSVIMNFGEDTKLLSLKKFLLRCFHTYSSFLKLEKSQELDYSVLTCFDNNKT